jgi:hypothetical protein
MAYTETLRAVYIIGVPCSILAFFGALLIKNSKMQTKAEEEEAIRQARAGDVDEEKKGKVEDDARVEREEEEAVALSAVGPVPQSAVPGGQGERVQ